MSASALLRIIAGRDTAGLYEVRCRNPRSGRITERGWFNLDAKRDCLWFIADNAPRLDVFIGAAPRSRCEGGKAAIQRVWCLWADLDTTDGLDRLRAFDPAPSLVVRSGTGDNVHAWWALSEPLSPAWAERANRRLAYALGADMKSTDAARILRPPGSLNHKMTPPVEVITDPVITGYKSLYPFSILKKLPDPPTKPPIAQTRSKPFSAFDDPMLGIPSEVYYERLTGRPVARGNVTCPFHSEGKERTPSLRLYGDGSWYCFACCEGGGIYQFGAMLWGIGTRGDDFVTLRERLTNALS